MPTTLPRVAVPFEVEIYEALQEISKAQKIPMSQLIHGLVTSALELAEDLTLSEVATKRIDSFRRDDALTTKELQRWNKTRKGKK